MGSYFSCLSILCLVEVDVVVLHLWFLFMVKDWAYDPNQGRVLQWDYPIYSYLKVKPIIFQSELNWAAQSYGKPFSTVLLNSNNPFYELVLLHLLFAPVTLHITTQCHLHALYQCKESNYFQFSTDRSQLATAHPYSFETLQFQILFFYFN